jgi:hypothetical protein
MPVVVSGRNPQSKKFLFPWQQQARKSGYAKIEKTDFAAGSMRD